MTDVHSSEVRSRNMAAIGAKDTKPELRFRKALHARGFRYRLHVTELPGRPDIVMPRYRAAIYVHGCFWHGHECAFFRWPQTRRDFWKAKIEVNRERDLAVKDAVLRTGWRHLIVWECAFRGGGDRALSRSADLAARWLRGKRRFGEIRGM